MAVALDLESAMPYGDGQALRSFALVHRLSHNAIAAAVAAQKSIATPNFDISDELAHSEWELLMLHAEGAPTAPSHQLHEWLLLHERLHQAEYDAVGFGLLPDLSGVNFHSPEQFEQWMYDHRLIHDAVENALGIS